MKSSILSLLLLCFSIFAIIGLFFIPKTPFYTYESKYLVGDIVEFKESKSGYWLKINYTETANVFLYNPGETKLGSRVKVYGVLEDGVIYADRLE